MAVVSTLSYFPNKIVTMEKQMWHKFEVFLASVVMGKKIKHKK